MPKSSFVQALLIPQTRALWANLPSLLPLMCRGEGEEGRDSRTSRSFGAEVMVEVRRIGRSLGRVCNQASKFQS